MFSRSLLTVRQSCCHILQRHGRVVVAPVSVSGRPLSVTSCKYGDDEDDDSEKKQRKVKTDLIDEGTKGYLAREVDPITSIKYMESDAYKATYGKEPVWKEYRRNATGKTYSPMRKTCIRGGVVSTASPCPVCRDDYLIFDYRNLKLLKQFVSELDGAPLNPEMTGLCQKQYKHLHLELLKAQEYGLMEKHIPHRKYDYEYYRQMVAKDDTTQLANQSQSGET